MKNHDTNCIVFFMLCGMIIMGCASSKAVAQETDDDPAPQVAESPLEGTWHSIEEGSTYKWIITNGKLRMYMGGKHLDNGAVYTYEITKDGKQCGSDLSRRLSRYPMESILVLTPLHSSEQKCFTIAGGSGSDTFTVFPFTSKYSTTFKKQ